MRTIQIIKQEICEFCHIEITPAIRRSYKVRRFCSDSCNNRYTYFKNREEYHNTYHCKCSFCKTERNITERIKTIVEPTRHKAQIEKQKLKYLRSERNLVT